MHLQGKQNLTSGLTHITDIEHNHPETGMVFSLLRLSECEIYANADQLERAYLLIEGKISLSWNQSEPVTIGRKNCFEQNPWVLHVPAGVSVKIEGLSQSSEISCHAAINPVVFPVHLYSPSECVSEERGKGTMNETSTRIVRTVFDYSTAPDSVLVLGEVIDFPGKWSSYPPHHHRQPEIYYYRFWPRQGFGYCELGEDVVKVRHNSTVLISPNLTHPQTTAPGYAMWYLWVIRHIDNDPYITPTFTAEHEWVAHTDAKIWPDLAEQDDDK